MAFDYNALSQATNLFQNFTNPQKHEILTVNSFQQVKDFVMNRGDSYMLLDPNADILYIKEKDSIGKENIRLFSLTEITEQFMNQSVPVTISKSDYDSLLKRLEILEGGKHDSEKPKQQPDLDFGSK